MKTLKLKNALCSLLAILFISITVTENTFAQITTNNGYVYFKNSNQYLWGNGQNALYYRTNHNTHARFTLYNDQDIMHGGLVGSRNPDDGSRYFGLVDSDGNWSYVTKTDSWTAFKINNENRMILSANGQLDINSNREATGSVGSGVLEIGNKLRLDDDEIITNQNTVLYINQGNNGDVIFDSNTLRVDASANRVGIGTASPISKLDVRGDMRVEALKVVSEHGHTYLPHSNKWSYIGGKGIVLRTNGNTERMRINSVGNVGIGTTNPINKLDVNGTIRAKEIKVEAGWSDYVFYDDYELPTLEEEEKHIEANGHLLGFESEEAMEGMIHLGDVSRRQQAKIEEMMLHLIDLKKEVTQLKEENDELKEEVKTLSNK